MPIPHWGLTINAILFDMKRTITAIIILFATVFTTNAQAQDLKLGYTNVEYSVSQLRDAKQIESEMQAHNKQLESQLKTKYQDYQDKAEDYQKNASR